MVILLNGNTFTRFLFITNHQNDYSNQIIWIQLYNWLEIININMRSWTFWLYFFSVVEKWVYRIKSWSNPSWMWFWMPLTVCHGDKFSVCLKSRSYIICQIGKFSDYPVCTDTFTLCILCITLYRFVWKVSSSNLCYI
jgi:hypothetical protein